MPPIINPLSKLVKIRKAFKDLDIYNIIYKAMDELPSTSIFLTQNVYYDPISNRSYTIRLSSGRLNPRAAQAMALRFNNTTASRNYIANTYLIPNGLRIAGNRIFDIRSTRGQRLFQREIINTRQVARARNIQEVRNRTVARTARNVIAPLRRRLLNRPIFNRNTIENVNARTRIFRFIYSFNDRGNWVAQIQTALNNSAYLDNIPNSITRTQIIISSLPANATADAHIANNNLRTVYAASSADALLRIIAKKQATEEEYEGLDWVFDTILINKIITPIAGQGGGRSEAVANATWLALDKVSKTNCFYNSLATIKAFTQKGQEADINYQIRIKNYLEDIPKLLKLVGTNGKSLKKNFAPNITNLVDLAVIQQYAEYTHGNNNQKSIYFQLYNNIFEKTYRICPQEIQDEIDNLGSDKKAVEKLLGKYKRYELQLLNNHFIPLVRWRDMGRTAPIPSAQEVVYTNEPEDYPIQKYNNKKNKNTGEWEKIIIPYNGKIAAYDLEATPNGVANGDFTTFCASFVYRDTKPPHELVKKSWYGLQCVKHYLDWISENMEQFVGYTIYAHNNGKFDMIQLFKDYLLTDTECPLKINPDKLIPLNGAYIGVSVYNELGEIDFKDSLKMLPSSLDNLGKEFDVPHKKLDKVVLPNGDEVSIDHDQVNIDNIRSYEIKNSQQIYCEQDSMCLLEILEIFSTDVYTATGINITDCFTGASLSKKHYYKNFYNRNKTPIYHLSNENDKYIRNSYYGGRNEAHYIGQYHKKVYYYDFTSLYPAEGRNRLPYGAPVEIMGEILDYANNNPDLIPSLPFGFYRCKVKTIDKERMPLHAIKNNQRLTFPIFENPTEITLFSEELKLGHREKQYSYELLDGIQFKNSKFMSKFFEDGFAKKGDAKANGKPALAQVYKIIINSGYGFFGLNTLGKDGNGRDGVAIYEKDTMDFWDLLQSDSLVNIGTCGNYNIVRSNKQLEITDFNVGVASAITSWARIKIWMFVDDIQKVGGEVLYMDTDSAIVNISMKDHTDIMTKYCWDGNGDQLGSMKNEADDEVAGYFKSKISKAHPTWSKAQVKVATKLAYKWQEKLDNGDLYFDDLIGGGCKQYALIKTLFDGGVVEVCKMKGYAKKGKKLHFGDFQDLTLAYYKQREIENKYEKKCKLMIDEVKAATGELIVRQDQTQFRTPLSYHLVDVRVEKWTVPKEFRIGYTKGTVQPNGYVIPLSL